MPTTRLTKKGLQRRSQILEAANRQLVVVGMEGLSLNSIAADVGISLGNLQHYFPRKKDLLLALLQSQIVPVEDMLAQFDSSKDSKDQLLENALRYVFQQNELDASCALVWSMTSMAFYDEEIKQLADHWFEIYQRDLCVLLSYCQPSLTKKQFKHLSISLMSMIEGHALIWRHVAPGSRQRVVAREAVIANMILLIEKHAQS